MRHDKYAAENARLRAALNQAQDEHENATAQQLRDEAEATLEKTEELWRLSSENERLNALLESIGEGAILSTAELLPSQHFTEPPPRFSEGSLVRCVCIPSPPSSRSHVPHLHSLACRSQPYERCP